MGPPTGPVLEIGELADRSRQACLFLELADGAGFRGFPELEPSAGQGPTSGVTPPAGRDTAQQDPAVFDAQGVGRDPGDLPRGLEP